MGIELFLHAAVQAGTPLLFATLGEIMTEKSGNLNLGVEGIMLVGAVFGFIAGSSTNSPLIALMAAFVAGACISFIYGLLTISLRANQVVTGLSITILGTGISGFLGKSLMGEVLSEEFKFFFREIKIPLFSKIPFIGDALFNQNVLVYLAYITAVAVGIYFYHTGFGLNLRSVGENPYSADAGGIDVTKYKYIHTMIGGGLCALGGAYLSLVYVPAWQENVTAGRGWIAVALVIFAGWSPYKSIIGAYLFGGLDIIGFRIQEFDIAVSPYIIDMLPYIVTIAVLVASSMKKGKKSNSPAYLGLSYFREER